MKAFGAERKASVQAAAGAARKRAAVETYTRNEAALRRTARRYSLCGDDADDALQRGLEILLRKAPTDDPRELIKWMQTVVKHEALAIRRERERILAAASEPDARDWVALLPSAADGPPERAERREEIARSREALRALKPQELRALTLLAEGYSYAEIGAITGYTKTKVNRCLAEGRERFRKLISSSEDGSRCREMRPLLSAFCDGEATSRETDLLREHLRACAGCRAALRAYRAAPKAARALAPLLPLDRSPLERVQDVLGRFVERFGGGGAAAVKGTTFVKATAACLATAGGVGACVATGLLPDPWPATGRDVPPRVERRAAAAPAEDLPAPKVSKPALQEEVPERAEPAPEPALESPGEYAPPPAPEPVPEPAPEPMPAAPPPGGGSPAGEFGP